MCIILLKTLKVLYNLAIFHLEKENAMEREFLLFRIAAINSDTLKEKKKKQILENVSDSVLLKAVADSEVDVITFALQSLSVKETQERVDIVINACNREQNIPKKEILMEFLLDHYSAKLNSSDKRMDIKILEFFIQSWRIAKKENNNDSSDSIETFIKKLSKIDILNLYLDTHSSGDVLDFETFYDFDELLTGASEDDLEKIFSSRSR